MSVFISIKKYVPTKLKVFIRSLLRPFSATQLFLSAIFRNLKWTLFSKNLPLDSNGKLALHLGCGAVDLDGFVNIDGFPFPNVHYVQRIDDLSRFKSSSVGLIYACHCLEHFKYSDVARVLSEWYRVLCPGGILRLSVPDFDKLVKIYQESGNDPDNILPQLMGGQENIFNFHYTTFNIVNLSKVLKSVGFADVQLFEPKEKFKQDVNDFSTYEKVVDGQSYTVSLNVQAVK